MLLSAGSVLVVAQSSSEIPEGLMNNPVYCAETKKNEWRCTSTRHDVDRDSFACLVVFLQDRHGLSPVLLSRYVEH